MVSLIGREIGKYRITERIGRGGMAEVYLGIHTHLERQVAIKVLHGHLLESGDFIERFKREAKAVANLRHPNIVQVNDFDIQDDLIFMVMEYIDGINLQERIMELDEEGERFPVKQIGSIINDIAGALDYAHSQGMLHRDVKPSNILIDKDGKAYLADFGIARIVSDQKLTATGTLIGTPAYMSPEQGRGDELTEESDIYSLGIVAFEMLTGQVPYDAQTPIGIVHKQITEPVPDMSDLVDGVPVSAQEVINRALAKSPEGRYSSAEELVRALRIALEALESTEVDEEILSVPTVAIPDATAPGEFDQPTVSIEKDKAPEQQDVVSPPEKETEKAQVAAKGSKRKIPTWGLITAGVALVAVVAVLTQVIDLSKPGSESEPSSISPVEPTAATAPDFSMAVGNWVGIDSDGSSMTMEIIHDSDSRYDIIFIDDVASVCGTGSNSGNLSSGRAETSGTAVGLTLNIKDVEFVCGETDKTITIEINLTYDPNNDTLTDNYDLEWQRKIVVEEQEVIITELAGTWEGDTGDFHITFFIEAECKLNEVCGTFEISELSLTGDFSFIEIDGDKHVFNVSNLSYELENSADYEYLKVLDDGTLFYYTQFEDHSNAAILYKE